MNTKYIATILLGAVLLSSCGGKETVKTDAGTAPVEAKTAPADAPTMAIIRLKEQGVTPEEAALVTDMLRDAIAQTGKYRVVEREQMEKIMQERAIKMADMTSDSAEAGVAKLLNARYMGLGSFGKLMGNYVLSFRVVDNETGMMKGAGTAEGKDLEAIKKGMSKIVGSL